MINGFAASIGDDVLAKFQNGYDGLLREITLCLRADPDGLSASVRLEVCEPDGVSDSWVQVVVEFSSVSFVRVDREWFVGGGSVLYNGGRLLVVPERNELVLDLDPGVCWLTSGDHSHESNFLMRGHGVFSVRTMHSDPIQSG